MTHRLLLLFVAVGIFAPPASAQQKFDRRARDEPEIVVEAGGRVGVCDEMLFSADGQFLFAAGDDKVARVWPYSTDAGLDTDRAKVKTLRWPAWREQRGGIKCLAVSPDGKQVAVGGFGMRVGTVAILDRNTGDTVALTWPVSRQGIDNFGTVMAVAFHPDGKRVAFGTADGSLWLWDPKKLPKPDANDRPSNTPRWLGKAPPWAIVKDKPAEFNFPRLIYFPKADTLTAIFQGGHVVGCDLTKELPESPAAESSAKPLFEVNDGQQEKYRVYRAAVTEDGKWFVIAFAGPRVMLRSTDGKTTVVLPLPEDHFPRSIAIHPKTGQLAVGVAHALPASVLAPRFYAEGNDEIWLYDEPTKDGIPKPTKLKHRGRVESLAFHPKDNRLAIAGGDADEVTLLNPAAPEKPVSVVRGAGRKPWAVNLTENGKVLGIRIARDATTTDPNRRGEGPWIRFDVPRITPTLDETQKWVDPITTADGWWVSPDETNRFVWYAVLKGVRHRLELDPERDQAPTCFTFLPARGGKPTRLIVGHYYGCSLFELTETGAVKTKIFTGHAGEVLSVVAAADQSWFVTGGADQTVAAWSLVD